VEDTHERDDFDAGAATPGASALALATLTSGSAPGSLQLPQLPADDPLYETAQAAGEYMKAAKAVATRKAYSSDWRHFLAWCEANHLAALPATPSTIALYLTSLARPGEGEKPRKAATITRRLTSINAAHKRAGLDSPATMNHRLVADTLHGIRRTLGVPRCGRSR
jgi:hypothetical protein